MVAHRKIPRPKIVQPGSGRRGWPLGLILFPGVLLVTSWYAYEYGRTGLLFDSTAADATVTLLERQVAGLQQQVKALESERLKLREEAAVLERTSQIDREAVRAAGEEIKRVQEGQLKMEEELVFLRGIISNKVDKKSLRIQDFRLQPTESQHFFQYSFTVSQVLNDKKGVKGDLFITVAGEQGGKKVSFELAALTQEKSKSLKVDLNHFQKFEGLLQLPEGFVASKMMINIKPSNKKLPRLSETFKWFVEE